MSYIDQILDRYGDEGDKVFYELYCQNNLNKLSNLSVETFEDIYYAFDIEEYEEYIDILLSEIVASAMEEYSYVKFLAEIPKSQWNDIITENLNNYQKKTKSKRIYDFYLDKVKLECKLK